MPSEQARAILPIVEMEIAGRNESRVARGELHAVELKLEQLRTEMKALGTKLVMWVFGMFVALGGLLWTAWSHRP